MFAPKSNNGRKAGRVYRWLMLSMFAYYITDALWGVFAGLNWIPLLFADTTVYYIAMSSYRYAFNSIPSKQKERYLVFADDYLNFIGEYPESDHRRELDNLYRRVKEK